MHFHIITLFPDVYEKYLQHSIIGRAIKKKIIKTSFYNPLLFLKDEKRLDDRPYGGGPGMVVHALPILRAFQKALGRKKDVCKIYLDARGKNATQKDIERWSKYKNIIFISGAYEGIDYRVVSAIKPERIRLGGITLTSGDLPALSLIDAISRELPGVLGNPNSRESTRQIKGKSYTRPETIIWQGKKYKVPKVLMSGHHGQIEKWNNPKM